MSHVLFGAATGARWPPSTKSWLAGTVGFGSGQGGVTGRYLKSTWSGPPYRPTALPPYESGNQIGCREVLSGTWNATISLP